MYFLSSQPFLKMWYSMPNRNGMSEPERMRTYSSALAAVRVKRGSTTIILRAGLLGVQHVQHGDRVRLGGVGADVQRALLFCMSLYELVIAP